MQMKNLAFSASLEEKFKDELQRIFFLMKIKVSDTKELLLPLRNIPSRLLSVNGAGCLFLLRKKKLTRHYI
jgi:hypothetical protein